MQKIKVQNSSRIILKILLFEFLEQFLEIKKLEEEGNYISV